MDGANGTRGASLDSSRIANLRYKRLKIKVLKTNIYKVSGFLTYFFIL
jgi:hypothetical protein